MSTKTAGKFGYVVHYQNTQTGRKAKVSVYRFKPSHPAGVVFLGSANFYCGAWGGANREALHIIHECRKGDGVKLFNDDGSRVTAAAAAITLVDLDPALF